MSQQKSAFNVVNDWVHTYLDIENSNFKKHIRQLESDLEDTKIQNEKKELKICEIECENRVFKKMIRKYDNLVDGLRQTVCDIAAFDLLCMNMRT